MALPSIRSAISSLRRSLRSVPSLRSAVHHVEDLLYPRHPQRKHPVIPFADGFPGTDRIHVRQEPPVALPLSEKLPCAPEAAHLASPVYMPPETFGALVPDVLFCPYNNVLLTDGRSVIAESVGPPHCVETLNRRPLSENRIERISGAATPLRSHYRNHYETLVDNLPRLALLHEAPFSDLDEIKILYSGGLTPIEVYLLPQLLPSNAVLHPINDDRRLYRVETYVLSTFLTKCYGSYLPASYTRWFRDRVLPGRSSTHNRRLFISRKDAPTRQLVNEAELIEHLAPLGFESVELASMSPEAQIELFYDAETVVAPHGAGLANLLFSIDTCVLELYPARAVRPCYYFLSEALGHCYDYYLPSPRAGATVFSNFEVEIPRVIDRLHCMLGS